MKIIKAWALVDKKGDVVFLNHQAEVYENKNEADVGNGEQDGEFNVIPCTITCRGLDEGE